MATNLQGSGNGTANLSFQLPDLLSLANTFPFRTNKHIKLATDGSESWLMGSPKPSSAEIPPPKLTELESRTLRGTKYGLLAGLACPTCDFPQLRLLADFFALIFTSHSRLLSGEAEQATWTIGVDDVNNRDGFELLALHPILSSLVPRLARALSSLPAEKQQPWKNQFTRSVRLLFRVQARISDSISNERTLSVSEYIALRREIYASSILWDIVEVLDIISRPKGKNPAEKEKLRKITQCAIDAVSWATDIFAYASPSRCSSHNLVSLLITHKSLSVQGAMNYVGGMIKETLHEFHRLERELIPSSNDQDSASWGWLRSIGSVIRLGAEGGANSSASPNSYLGGINQDSATPDGWSLNTHWEDDTFDDPNVSSSHLARYILALKDYVIGSMHWGYETELFFGVKGDEVRSFGWVFLNNQ